MGSNFQRQQEKISSYIFTEFISERDTSHIDNVLKNIQMLIDNNLASSITGSENIASLYNLRFRVACKFLTKYDKELKNHFRRPVSSSHSSMRIAGADKNLLKLNNYILDAGVYFVDLGNEDKDDYALLKVEAGEDGANHVKFNLVFIGYRHNKFKNKYFKMVEKYEELSEKSNENYIMYSDRRPSKYFTFKSFDQMVIRDKDKILKYIDNWIENIPKYSKYGISPKLSILLHGDPGTGKSTFSNALAKYLDIDSCTSISPNFFTSGKSNLSTYFPTVFTIDDIDCVCESRKDNKSKDNNNTLSALLEFLDHPETFYYKAKDGYHYPISIIVASTNYIDKLDPAVKRHGRFDLKIEMGNFNKEEAEEMCALYDLTLEDVYDGKVDKNFTISPSYLQALCLENIDKTLKSVD